MKHTEKKIIMNKVEIGRTIKRLAHEIVEKNFGAENMAIVGIQTRGVNLGRRILGEIVDGGLSDGNKNIPFGIIDINLYRDDVASMDTPPQIRETDVSFDISGKKIILVDDVIFTGRSIRAALDELMDFGRPKNIQLAVLVDRGHRELPIEPNFVGKKFLTSVQEFIDVELQEVDGQDRVVLKEKQ